MILNDRTKVIGINKKGISKTKEDYADSIGPIFNFIKNGFIYMQNEEKNMKKLIEEDEEDKLIDNLIFFKLIWFKNLLWFANFFSGFY